MEQTNNITNIKKSNNEILELPIVYLLQTEPFYANLLLQIRRNISEKCPAIAAVSITDRLNLHINPTMFDNPELLNPDKDKWLIKDKANVLKHELFHLINNHIPRSKELDMDIDGKHKFNNTALNIAMDCAINQLSGINTTVEKIGGVTLDSFTQMLGMKNGDVKAGENWEYYFQLMRNKKDELVKQYGEGLEGSGYGKVDDHGNWKDSEVGSEIAKDVIKNAVKKAKETTERMGGNMPTDIQMMIEELFRTKINWKRKLRNFLKKTIPMNKRKTRAKRNRRYGILFPGRKKTYTSRLGIGLDVSGSMSDDDIKRAFSEVYKISQTMDIELTVIEADTRVTQVYKYDPKKPPQVKGRGGTLYQPVFDKATELGLDGVLFLGDMGAFDEPQKPKYPVMWGVIGGDYKPPATFGEIINIEFENDNERV